MRSAAVIGTGLVGTSAALALGRCGVTVHLIDTDEASARTASSLGAGIVGWPDDPVELAIVAVPPKQVGSVLAAAQRHGRALSYTDVASVKTRPDHEVVEAGGDRATYVGGHPLAGAERSGPLAARADLFEGRPWVLTPSPETGRETLNRALELVSLCGALPVVMEPTDHDHAVALVSHAPHLIAAVMAARLEHAADDAVRLAGQGVRDVTRIAASDPGLWQQILECNAVAVADVLADCVQDLSRVVEALRALGASDTAAWDKGMADVVGLLRRGNSGHARIPGKHGAPPAYYEPVAVTLTDAPGELARLFAAVGEVGVNVEDVTIEHVSGQPAGLVTLLVAPTAADRLVNRLVEMGWAARH